MYKYAGLAAGIAVFLITASPAYAAVADWQRGANVVSTYSMDFTSDNFHQSLQNLKAIGANTVELVLPLAQDSQNSSSVYGTAAMPSTTTLAAAIDYAHSIGLAVVLKPHVDVANNWVWRAYIDPSNRNAWFASYDAELVSLAAVAQAHHAEGIVIGTELITLSANDQYSDNTAHWRSLISQIRGVYSGKLSYAANWGTGWADEKNRIAFWDALDYAGIDAYYPLGSDYYNNSVSALTGYWSQIDASDIAPFKAKVGKPIVFTEVGYMSTNGAHTTPGDGGHVDGLNMTEQANDYQALLSYWANSPEVAGMDIWEWKTNPNAGGTNDWDYTPQNKPAQDMIASYWTGSGPISYSFTANAAATSTVIGSGVPVVATIANTGSQASGLIIDLEVYDASGAKVFQKFYDGQSIAAGAVQNFSASWTPASVGTYTEKVGVFSAGWAQNYVWNNSAAQITIAAAPSTGGGTTSGTAPLFSAIASAPSSVTLGSVASLIANVTDIGGAGAALVDMEIYDASGAKVNQMYLDSQSFAAGQARQFTDNWTPSALGSYVLKLGVFAPGWSHLYTWLDSAASILVTNASAPAMPPSTGTTTPSQPATTTPATPPASPATTTSPTPPTQPPSNPPAQPPTTQSNATISPASQTVSAGQAIDFTGKNFGHEENVTISLAGSVLRTAHADGGGNFSTGSISVPTTSGTYTYTFIGVTSGYSATASIVVQ